MGFKKILQNTLAILMTLTMVNIFSIESYAAVVSVTYSNNVTNNTITVKPGDIFSIDLTFAADSAIKSSEFSLISYKGLTLINGNNTINNVLETKTTSLTFGVPMNFDGTSTEISYTVNYSYDSDNISLATATVDSQTFSVVVNVGAGSDNTDDTKKGYVYLQNASVKDVIPGEDVKLLFDIINTDGSDVKNVNATIVDNYGKTVATKSIGTVSASSTTNVAIDISSYDEPGPKSFEIYLDFMQDGYMRRIRTSVNFKVSSSEPLTIDNLTFDEDISVGAEVIFTFDIVNRSKEVYNNCQAYLYEGTVLLKSVYIGSVDAQNMKEGKISHTFTENESKKLRIEIKYDNTAGTILTAEKPFNVHIGNNATLSFNNVIIPGDVKANTVTNFRFDILNSGDKEVSNVQAYLYKGDEKLTSVFIGKIEPQTQNSTSISYTFPKAGSGTFKLLLTYNDVNGNELRAVRDMKLTIKSYDGSMSQAGTLKIQSIMPDFEPAKETLAKVSFSLTNPSTASIFGAEAFLYDSGNNLVNSLYISELAANKMETMELSFPTGNYSGTKSFAIVIKYNEQDGTSREVSKNFNVTVVELKKEEEKSEEPSNIRIQKIDSPAVLYTNVKSDIPYTLVNAGKGTAYNVEIYVVDDNGNEVAREYVGNLTSSQSTTDIKFPLKFIETGDINLTLFVDYYHYNNAMETTSKSFSLNVVDYRASVSDISGLDYVEIGYQTNVEFSLINNGTVNLLNTNAFLLDSNGNELSKLYIGTVDAGKKLERQKFRNVMFTEAGTHEFTVKVEYENSDMQVFSFEGKATGNIMEPYVPEPMPDDMMNEFPMDGVENPEDSEGKTNWLLIIGIGVGVLVVITVVIILVVRKRKKSKNESDDMDFFLNQLAVTQNQPAKVEGNLPETEENLNK